MATVYLKDFPDQIHREAKSQAALMGVVNERTDY
jgi:hypothetical protein